MASQPLALYNILLSSRFCFDFASDLLQNSRADIVRLQRLSLTSAELFLEKGKWKKWGLREAANSISRSASNEKQKLIKSLLINSLCLEPFFLFLSSFFYLINIQL